MARQENEIVARGGSNKKIKDTLDFLLHSYRAILAVENPTENCLFNFHEFLQNWKDRYENWSALENRVRQDLLPLSNQGVFDSILPYLTVSLNQSKAKREHDERLLEETYEPKNNGWRISAEVTPLSQLQVATNLSDAWNSGGKQGASKTKARTPSITDSGSGHDPEITIHVCDEAKGAKQDFYCPQSILVKEMGYFTKVTVKGQRLRDMDISVHCDISVFEWLLKWVKSQNGCGAATPQLDSSNVIGLLVSADFLQMSNLVSWCLEYAAANIGQVINLSPNLGCLNESLTSKLLRFFSNFEVETKISNIDKTDRITSRFYTQLIMALNEKEPAESLGHFASTATLFRCSICGQLLINSVASKVVCCTLKSDCRGRVYTSHIKDPNWTLVQHIRNLKKELKTWKKVYWRLWSAVHYFSCSQCELYFPVIELAACRYHPGKPVAASFVVVNHSEKFHETSGLDDTKTNSMQHSQAPFRNSNGGGRGFANTPEQITGTIVCPYGNFSCCNKPSYQFSTFPDLTGCGFRDHAFDHYSQDDPALKLISFFRELIVEVPKAQKAQQNLEWSNLIDLTSQKLPSTSSTAIVVSQRYAILSSVYGLTKSSKPPLSFFQRESSSMDSNSVSENEEMISNAEEMAGYDQRMASTSNFWSWNPEFTTRYNQDMQREREERLMLELELYMAQRVAISSSDSQGFPSGFRIGYMNRRAQKNTGGSYVKLEDRWREEVTASQNGLKSARHFGKKL